MATAGAQNASPPRARHWIPLIALLLLVAATVLPPLINIGRYQHRIADSISRSVGRPVRMGTVQLRLLPRPGFEIEELVISEDPAFGPEPMLHAASVVANIRLVSLWRGRLEISRISFDEASLNLVRNAAGQWNVGSVLNQASRIPNAPTAQRHAGGAPRFPYIEASNARINFKFGNVKQPFSFLNSELSVWLDQPDQWQLRFEAQPARTDLDLNLSDTGLLQLQGTLRRSTSALGEMPLNLEAEWSNAPFGQLTRLLLGEDSGWRGALDVRAEIHGSANNAQIKARFNGSGVHRVEFEPPQSLELETTCQANYSHSQRSINDLTCFSPTGEGHLLLTGNIADISDRPQPKLTLRLEHLPAASVLSALRVVRAGFAPTVTATGTVDGEFNLTGPALPAVEGQATVHDLALQIPGFARPLLVPSFPVSAQNAAPAPPDVRGKPHAPPPLPSDASLNLSSVSLAMGATAPLTLGARLTPAGFDVHLAGGSTVDRMILLSKALGLTASPLNGLAAQGTADLQLGIQGAWLLPVPDADHPAAPVLVAGTVRLHNAVLTPAFLAAPLQVSSALGTVSQNQIAWAPLTINYGKMRADGSYTQPLFCADPDGCPPTFDIRVDSLSAAELQSTLLGGKHGQMLEQILDRLDSRSHSWPAMQGRLHAGAFLLDTMKLQNATATLTLKANHLSIDSLDCQTLGGELHLTGTLDTDGSLPVYAIDAQLHHADPSQVAALFGEKWGTGSLNFSSQLHLTGFTADRLASSSQGKFHWDWTSGSLPVETDSLPVLAAVSRFDRWTADGTVNQSRLNLTRSLLVHEGDELPLAGSLSFDRELQLRLGDADRQLEIGGTLERPRAAAPAKAASITPAALRHR